MKTAKTSVSLVTAGFSAAAKALVNVTEDRPALSFGRHGSSSDQSGLFSLIVVRRAPQRQAWENRKGQFYRAAIEVYDER